MKYLVERAPDPCDFVNRRSVYPFDRLAPGTGFIVPLKQRARAYNAMRSWMRRHPGIKLAIASDRDDQMWIYRPTDGSHQPTNGTSQQRETPAQSHHGEGKDYQGSHGR